MSDKHRSSPTLAETMARLRALSRPHQLEGMARYGIAGEGRLGVSIPSLRALARSIGKNHRLAVDLWKSEVPDAMILAAYVDEPEKLTGGQMDRWVVRITSWDVCDQVCSNLFDRTPLAWEKIRAWSVRNEEFVKRAGYVLIATLAIHEGSAPDRKFTNLFPLIIQGASDNRNYVKKAVCWALRHIGKRNDRLRRAAIDVAHALRKMSAAPARWIAAETLRELENPDTIARVRSRSLRR